MGPAAFCISQVIVKPKIDDIATSHVDIEIHSERHSRENSARKGSCDMTMKKQTVTWQSAASLCQPGSNYIKNRGTAWKTVNVGKNTNKDDTGNNKVNWKIVEDEKKGRGAFSDRSYEGIGPSPLRPAKWTTCDETLSNRNSSKLTPCLPGDGLPTSKDSLFSAKCGGIINPVSAAVGCAQGYTRSTSHNSTAGSEIDIKPLDIKPLVLVQGDFDIAAGKIEPSMNSVKCVAPCMYRHMFLPA